MKKHLIFFGGLMLVFAIFQGLSSYGFRRNIASAARIWFGKGDQIAKRQLQSASSQPRPALIDVGAEQCVPCRKMAPILDDLTEEYAGSLMVEFIDVWKNRDAEAKYRIRVIPTQIFYDPEGKELKRHYGFISKEEILGTFKTLGFDLKKHGGT